MTGSHNITDNDSSGDMDDINILMDVIQQFSDRLRNMQDSLDRQRIQLIIATAMAFAGLMAGIISSAEMRPDFLTELGEFYKASITILVGGIAALLLAYFMLILSRLRGLRFECERVAHILSRLIMRASQMRDRGKLGLSRDIFVDVKLADAEAALSRARSSIRPPSYSLIGRFVRSIT